MVYIGHQRITFSGFLGSTAAHKEIWSCTLNWGNAAPAAFLTLADVDGVAAAFRTFWGSTTAKVGSTAVLDQVKGAVVGTTGRVTGPVVYATAFTPLPGGSGMAAGIPYQISNALSLRTGLRGPSNRGRIFLPQPTFNVGVVSGTIADDTALADFLATFKTFVVAAETHVLPLCVASVRGHNAPVTVIEAGRVLDTIRKRRNKLREDYVSLAL